MKQAILRLSELCREGGRELGALLPNDVITTDCAMELYTDDALPLEDINSVLNICSDEQFEKYRVVIQQKSGILLPARTRTHYEEIRSQRDHEYFSILFDKTAAQHMLKDLLFYVDNPNITVKELSNTDIDFDWFSPFIVLQYAMCNYASGDTLAKDFFDQTDWDTFVLCEANRRIAQTKIVPTEHQIESLSVLLQKKIGSHSIDSILNEYYETGRLAFATSSTIQLAVRLNISFSEDCLLKMTQLPNRYLSIENDDALYQFLLRHLESEKLKRQIICDLETGLITEPVLNEHIEYCRIVSCDAAVRYALELCRSTSVSAHSKYGAVKYLYEIKGPEFIEEAVLSFVDGNILCMIAGSYEDISQKALKEAMEAVYRISPSENLQKSLISYGSEIALEQYVSNLSETHVLPEGDVMFADGPTSAICSVKDPSLLPLLGQLLEIVFIPEFKDAVFFTLREGLIEAFLHCSNADPDASLAEIEKHSGGAAASAKNTSIYETIREDAKKQQLRKANQAWTIESVEKYWRELEHKAQQT